MIGRQDTGPLSSNHMRAFRPSFSKAETGFNTTLPGEQARLAPLRRGVHYGLRFHQLGHRLLLGRMGGSLRTTTRTEIGRAVMTDLRGKCSYGRAGEELEEGKEGEEEEEDEEEEEKEMEEEE